MDDGKLGVSVRALRRRRNWRQRDLAEAAGVSQSLVSLIERGHVDRLSIRVLRRILAALDARADVDVRWRGGGLDRLLDERHAELVGAVVRELTAFGWSTEVEATYARFGERGSIDVLALGPGPGALLVVEVKSELTSIEDTLRRLDEKVRLGPRIAAERQGWVARTTSRLLVLPETRSSRDRIARSAALLDAVFPVRGVALRAWLREPVGVCSGIRLLRLSNPGGRIRASGGAHRVRVPRGRSDRPRSSVSATEAGHPTSLRRPETG